MPACMGVAYIAGRPAALIGKHTGLHRKVIEPLLVCEESQCFLFSSGPIGPSVRPLRGLLPGALPLDPNSYGPSALRLYVSAVLGGSKLGCTGFLFLFG